MNRQPRHRALAATAAVLVAMFAAGAATASPIQRNDGPRSEQLRKDHRQVERKAPRKAAPAIHREAARPARAVAPQRQRTVAAPRVVAPRTVAPREVAQARHDDRRDARHDRRQDRRADRRDARHDRRQDRRADRRDARHDRREHRQDVRHDVRRDIRHDARRDAQRRIAYARYRQDYERRMRTFRVVYAPRYYVRPAHYRYFRSGIWYTTSNYGADVLRQAVDLGYREGMRAGRADRYDGWPADYRDSIAWRNGGFGFGGRYVSPADYAYYFRQGFQRGYDDGYFGRMQYGRYVSNDAVIAEAVIATILGLQLLR